LLYQKEMKLWPNRMTTANGDVAGPHYSLKYTNGTQTIEDTRNCNFSSDRVATREAFRTAREMANDVSWQSSTRGVGWKVLALNSMGQQICEAPVRFKRRWF